MTAEFVDVKILVQTTCLDNAMTDACQLFLDALFEVIFIRDLAMPFSFGSSHNSIMLLRLSPGACPPGRDHSKI
jgi:hypothetical protein